MQFFSFKIIDVGHVGKPRLETRASLVNKAEVAAKVLFETKEIEIQRIISMAGKRLEADSAKRAAIIQCRASGGTPKGYVVAKTIGAAHQHVDKFFLEAEEAAVEVLYFN